MLSALTVEGSTFLNNDSSSGSTSSGHGAGGAIYTDGASKRDGTTSGTIAIRDSVFRGNTSTGEGGAAFTWIYPPDQVIIERTTFQSNTVLLNDRENALGGGLRHGNGLLTLSDTTFAYNVARRQGGGFWTDGSHPATLTNVTFAHNRAASDDTAAPEDGLGGAIAGGGNFTCTNCTLAYNDAGNQAGAIYGGEDITCRIRYWPTIPAATSGGCIRPVRSNTPMAAAICNFPPRMRATRRTSFVLPQSR